MRMILLIGPLFLVSGTDGWSNDADRVAAAQDLIRDGKYADALKKLEAPLKHDEQNVSAQLTAVAACLGLHDANCAIGHFSSIPEAAWATQEYQLLLATTRNLQAKRAAAKGDRRMNEIYSSEAADAYGYALNETPGDPALLAARAKALCAAHRNTEARDAYHAWVAADPRNPGAYGAAAAFMAETGIWDETTAMIEAAPKDDPRLPREIRLAVMRNGIKFVPWETIGPLFDAVEAEETDSNAKQALRAYRTIRSSEGRVALLAVLDYLDADPADHLCVRSTFLNGSKASQSKIHIEKVIGFVEPARVASAGPDYPDIARRARIEGKVVLLVRIRKDGFVSSVHVISSSNEMFDEASIRCVEKWRYKPASLWGEVVEMPYTVRVDFRLK